MEVVVAELHSSSC
jgi:hypothetical protein